MNDKQNGFLHFFRSNGLWTALAALILVAGAIALTEPTLLAPAPTAAPENLAAAGERDARAAEGCELVQTFRYGRCEHVVTRRVAAPAELIGKTLAQVQPLYDGWQITVFSPKEIHMSCQPELFCPDHLVLMSNEAGVLCIFRNTYGDALALVRELETPLSALSAAMREEARRGLGFEDESALERWLESAES